MYLCVCVYIYIYIYIYIYMCVCIYIYKYMPQKYIHTPIYVKVHATNKNHRHRKI
jgi:hypothetical protein